MRKTRLAQLFAVLPALASGVLARQILAASGPMRFLALAITAVSVGWPIKSYAEA